MSSNSSLSRGLAVAFLFAGQAFAQAPVNDACSGAEQLTVPASGAFANSGVTANIDQAVAGVETTMACSGTAQTRSVWYTFTAPVTGVYRVATCGVTNFDTAMQVYSGTCGSLTSLGITGCNDDGCATFSASGLSALSLVGGTTYFVQVAAYAGFTTVTSSSRVGLSVNLLVKPVNDSCTSPTPLALNVPLSFSTNALTLNDSTVGGNLDGGAGTCYVGTGHSTSPTLNAAPGRDVVFTFVPTRGGSYNVRLGAAAASSSSTVNSVVYLTDSCVDAMTPPAVNAPPQCIAASNRAGSSTSVGEELVCMPLQSGRPVFVWADEGAQSTAGATYELEVTECTPEVEPNDTPAQAAPLACPISGGLPTTGELDYFDLGTSPAGARVFAMVEANSSGNTGLAGSNFDLRLTTSTDTLEFDDGDLDALFGGLSATIAGSPMPTSQAFLRVNQAAGTPLSPYRLYSVVQTAAPSAETEPNDTSPSANVHAANYFSGEVTATTDVDLFAFDARAGDLVFLSLDAQPSRSGATSTGNHTLQLLTLAGTTLVAVNDGNTSVNNTLSAGALDAGSPQVPAESLVYRIRTTGTYLARVGRTATTGSGQYLLSISTGCGTGGGIVAPGLTSLTPATGSFVGNTSVTLTGSNFSVSASVLIGGVAATVVTRTPTRIEVLTPPGAEGLADVTVANPGGLLSTLAGGFTYFSPVLPPSIATVTPASGPTAGGTVLTITGSLFKAGAEVSLTVGGVRQPATNVVVVDATQLRATTPAQIPGLASITVRNPVDALEGTRADAFTFLAPPTVSSITPNTGFTSGGQTITLQGTAFRLSAVVRFGANPGVNVVVDPSGTSLTVTTPEALVSGVVSVTVVNADTQQTLVTNGFTYSYPPPAINSITPSVGFSSGGTSITIVGTGFQATPTVTVGGASATSINRVSLTEIRATTPAGTTGLADVTVTNIDGKTVTRAGGFRYRAAPTVTTISPANGPMQGGTRITLTGTAFQAGASVRLGGVPAFAVTVENETTATAVTNANAAGLADVVFTNPDTQTFTLPAAYTYNGAPVLSAFSPSSGTTAGGTVITLTGSGFLTGVNVLFGTSPATAVTVNSTTQLTATTPATPVSVVSVTTRNTDGQSASLLRAFRFVAPPSVTGAAPDEGDVGGGTVVRVTGAGFNASTTVSFGGTAAARVSQVSATELDAVTPRHLPGVVDVQVSTDGAVATLTGGFTFTRSAPTLVAVAPVSGPIAGGTLLTLSGTGFAPGATITVGGGAASDVVVVSDVLARAVVPAHAAGAVDVALTNDDAQAATLAGGFTYVAPPSNNAGTVTDGGSGSIGADPTDVPAPGGASCGCASVDGSMFSMAGFGLLMVLSRRRRHS